MANVLVSGSQALLLSIPADPRPVLTSTATSYRFGNSDADAWEFSGTGFTYDGSRHLIGGTVVAFSVTVAARTVLALTGLSLDAVIVQQRIQSGKSVAMFSEALSGNDTIAGGNGDDTLSGGPGNDTIDGGTGVDTLEGGPGDDVLLPGPIIANDPLALDVLSYASAPAGVTVDLRTPAPQDTGGAGVDTVVGFGRVIGSAFDDVLTAGPNVGTFGGRIEAGAGNDRLSDGGVFHLTLTGGPGDDVYVITLEENATTQLFRIMESANEGTDEVRTPFGWSLMDFFRSGGVENLVLTGDADIDGMGSSVDNTLTGNSGDNTLDGREGIDTVSYAGFQAPLVLSLQGAQGFGQSADAGSDVLLNFENAIGSQGNDTLTGSSARNVLNGGPGDDVLEGLGGDDTLIGGPGLDVASYLAAPGTVTVNLTLLSGQNTLAQGVDILSGIEGLLGGLSGDLLIGDGSGNVIDGGGGVDTISGGSGNDRLTGDAGSDTISGGPGDDWIEGERGNSPFAGTPGADILAGDDGNDIVLGGDGNDRIFGGSGVDVLVGEAGNDLVYGDAELDYIDGRAGSDQLYGGDGNDVIFGDADNDYIRGGNGDDIIMGERGEASAVGALDVIEGESGNDLLDGGAGPDWIYGGDGNDIIDGDLGSDYIVGGPGAEIMLGSAASDFGPETEGRDLFVYTRITDAGDRIWGFDLRPGDSDGIDLRPLFDVALYGGTTPRQDAYLRIVTNGPDTQVQVDPNGASGGAQFTTLVTLIGVDLNGQPNPDSYFLYQ